MISRLRAFGLFWVDFLVGDAPELALGGLIILGIAYALHNSMVAEAVVVPSSVVLLMGVSLWRGRGR